MVTTPLQLKGPENQILTPPCRRINRFLGMKSASDPSSAGSFCRSMDLLHREVRFEKKWATAAELPKNRALI